MKRDPQRPICPTHGSWWAGPSRLLHHLIKASPTSMAQYPCLPGDGHSPHAWPHPLGPWALQPTYGQTPEGHGQQYARQWPPHRPTALGCGHWNQPHWILLYAHRTGCSLEGVRVLRGPGRSVGDSVRETVGLPRPSPISEGTGTHCCGAQHLDHRGRAVLSGLSEGRWAREKLWPVPREDCNGTRATEPTEQSAEARGGR